VNACSTTQDDMEAAIRQACSETAPAAGAAVLAREIARRCPELAPREVLVRGGWYRLGGVIAPTGARISEDLEAWAESELAACDGDLARLLDEHTGSGLMATRLTGVTHYFVAPAGPGATDTLQIEIEELQEVTAHALFDREPPPTSLEELVDPRLPREQHRPLGAPYYLFRRLTHIGEFLARMRAQKPEAQPIHRFVDDWQRSSASHGSLFANHWMIACREHLDRYRQPVLHAHPVAALTGEAPRFRLPATTRGLDLHHALATFDRQAGYPFAWYFHMLTTKAVPYWVASAAIEDSLAGFNYLPDRDLAVLRDWLHQGYAF